MPEHSDPSFREVPPELEHKDTRGTMIGYKPSPVPHLNRTGSALTDEERRVADQHGDLAYGFSGVPEEDADTGGIHTATGGTQTRQSGSTPKQAAKAPKAQTSGAASNGPTE